MQITYLLICVDKYPRCNQECVSLYTLFASSICRHEPSCLTSSWIWSHMLISSGDNQVNLQIFLASSVVVDVIWSCDQTCIALVFGILMLMSASAFETTDMTVTLSVAHKMSRASPRSINTTMFAYPKVWIIVCPRGTVTMRDYTEYDPYLVWCTCPSECRIQSRWFVKLMFRVCKSGSRMYMSTVIFDNFWKFLHNIFCIVSFGRIIPVHLLTGSNFQSNSSGWNCSKYSE